MKALVLKGRNKLSLLKLRRPLRLKDGQVLVRVKVAGICGAQLQEITGEKDTSMFMPHCMGHEGCVVVENIGPGVDHLQPGDRCVAHWRKSRRGMDAVPASYGEVRGGPVHTFCDYAILSSNRLTKICREEAPDDLLALMGCALSTAMCITEKESKIRFGDSVLIIGAGGLGMSLALAARGRGAGEVLMMDREEQVRSKAKVATSLGVKLVSKFSSELYHSFDHAIDTTGSNSETGLNLLANGGTMVQLVCSNSNIPVRSLFGAESKRIVATQAGGFDPQEDLERLIDGAMLLPWKNLITHRFPLKEYAKAIDIIKSGKSGRVMLYP